MGKAKDILLKPMPTRELTPYMKRWHYSGKVDTRTQLSIGVYYKGKLEGGMQFGPSMAKHNTRKLFTDIGWNEFIELHRLAFTDKLPRNSESRAISVAIKLLKKHAPHVKVLISYADATQCGDGTIYRASGFELTGITENNTMWEMPDGEIYSNIVFEPGFGGSVDAGVKKKYGKKGGETSIAFFKKIGAKRLNGFQLRYMYFLDPDYKDRLIPEILPYSAIEEAGATMYKGEKTSG